MLQPFRIEQCLLLLREYGTCRHYLSVVRNARAQGPYFTTQTCSHAPANPATTHKRMSSAYDRAAVTKLKDACFRAKYLIKIYAAAQTLQPDAWSHELRQDINVEDMQWLIQQFEMRDIASLPTIELRSRLALAGAWSRYVPEVNAIYLAEDFVKQMPKPQLITVIFQEIINAAKQFR